MAGADSSSDGSRLIVAGDELDILDTGAIGDGDGADDLAGAEFPEAECVGLLDPTDRSRLENGNWDDEVGCQDDVVLPVNGQTMGTELLAKNVECAFDIFGPLVDDVEIGIGLNETSRRSTNRGAHVGNEETAIGLGADLISDGGKDTTVALLELGGVWVACVEVVRSILCVVRKNARGVVLMGCDLPESSTTRAVHRPRESCHLWRGQDDGASYRWMAHQ